MQRRSQTKKSLSKPKQKKKVQKFKSPRSVSKQQEKIKFQPKLNTIYFYGKDSANGFMSNFYPSIIEIDLKVFPTVQHYFQSRKFVGTPQEQKLINARSPGAAFRLARQYKSMRPENWDELKIEVMKKGLRAKFNQHHNLRKMLLETGEKDLVQHTWKDKFWADGGGPGKGVNKLGQLLMEVRDEIRKEK